MKSRWTARAEVGTPVIGWLAIIMAGLIMVTWFLTSGAYTRLAGLDILDRDMLHIQLLVDEACNSIRYHNSYNPLTEKGEITFSPDEICISLPRGTIQHRSPVTRCTTPLCDLGLDASFDLASISELVIDKDATITIRAQ
jgi:hypothetical protein